MTEPSRDAQAHPQTVAVGVTIPQISIKMRTHLWISCARIALKHEATAHAARQVMQQPGTDQSRLLEREADAGLVGICAAAFALEALSRELDELGVIPPPTLAAWQASPPSAPALVLEILKLSVDPRRLVNTWERELAWLFGVRGSSVHYRGAFEAPQPHPIGTNVAPSQVTYSAENATRAVDLLLEILERCRDKPKPATRGWSQGMRGAVDELIGRRGQAG
jgi:hypothetical protein